MINDIFNATKTAQKLLHDYKSDKLSHAYMLIGEKGSGKKTLVNAFAQLIMCEDPHGIEPCGHCASCNYFESFGTHPNVVTISADNKASIGIADIRELSDGVYTAPYIGSKKIYIIADADKMTVQAQNALLKILEEPPEYVIFFLLVSNRYTMLTTIISRCRTVSMSPYTRQALTNLLVSRKTDLSEHERDILIQRCQGSPGKLISILETDDTYRNTVFEVVNALIDGDIEKILDVTQIIDSRESALSFVKSLSEIMRDAYIYMLCHDDRIIFNADKTELIENIANKSTLKHITHFLNESSETIKMLSGNVSYQLCVKNLLMKW